MALVSGSLFHSPSLSVSTLNAFARQLRALAPDVRQDVVERTDAILARTKLSALDLLDPEARIPLSTASEVVKIVGASVGPGLGLRAAEEAELGDLGIYEYVARTCSTLGEGIETACRYLPLAYDAADFKLIVDGDQVTLRYQLRDEIPSPVTFVEFALAACVVASRRALGFAGVPRSVSFTHSEPEYAALYARIFGAPLRFDQPHSEIVFGRRAWHFPLVSADPVMHAIFRGYAERLLELLPTAQPLSRAVQKLLRERMDARHPELDDLPLALHMSERTLRRKLTAEGVQLRTLIDQTRREQALRYLTSSSLSVSEIAYRLGFAHPPAFHRAFRRWFGASPLTYQRKHAFAAEHRS